MGFWRQRRGTGLGGMAERHDLQGVEEREKKKMKKRDAEGCG